MNFDCEVLLYYIVGHCYNYCHLYSIEWYPILDWFPYASHMPELFFYPTLIIFMKAYCVAQENDSIKSAFIYPLYYQNKNLLCDSQ